MSSAYRGHAGAAAGVAVLEVRGPWDRSGVCWRGRRAVGHTRRADHRWRQACGSAERAESRPSAPARHLVDGPVEARPLLAPEGPRDSGENALAAQAVASAALRDDPDNLKALANLGTALLNLQEPAKALPLFEHAARLAPDQWTTQFNLARAQVQLGRWNDAVASLQSVRTMRPDDYTSSFNLALALHRSGDDERAIDGTGGRLRWARTTGRCSDRLASACSEVGARRMPCARTRTTEAGAGRGRCRTDQWEDRGVAGVRPAGGAAAGSSGGGNTLIGILLKVCYTRKGSKR